MKPAAIYISLFKRIFIRNQRKSLKCLSGSAGKLGANWGRSICRCEWAIWACQKAYAELPLHLLAPVYEGNRNWVLNPCWCMTFTASRDAPTSGTSRLLPEVFNCLHGCSARLICGYSWSSTTSLHTSLRASDKRIPVSLMRAITSLLSLANSKHVFCIWRISCLGIGFRFSSSFLGR